MGILIAIIPFLIWFGLAFYLEHKSRSTNDYEFSISLSASFTVILLIVLLISNLVGYYSHICNLEELNVIEDRIEVYENRLDRLENEVKSILVESYGQHEKELFDNMSPEGLSLFLVKYPELRASETFIDATNKLIGFNDKIYEQEIQRIELNRIINTRRRSPVVFRFILPKE